MKTRTRRIVLVGSAILLFGWLVHENLPVQVNIHTGNPAQDFAIWMPRKDKKRLDYFFRETCFMGVWAYTLAGSKPMSIDQYIQPWTAFRRVVEHPDFWGILQLCFWPPHYKRIEYLLTPHQLKMKLGWETLQKQMKHFPDSRFVLNSYPRDDGFVIITLIDKIKLIDIVKKCHTDFEDLLLLQKIEPDDLIDGEKLVLFLDSLEHKGEGVIGTLLGYGRDNAWAYHRHAPLISAWADEQEAHLDKINNKILSFQPWDSSDLFYPRFVCDPMSEETKQLKQTYREERGEIIHYLEGKDLVEAMLSLFYASNPK